MSKRVPFQTIQFGIRTHFSSLWHIDGTLSGAIVDLGAMAMMGYSVFSKAPAWLEPHHQIDFISRTLIGSSYHSAEVHSVYSTAPADWAMCVYVCEIDRERGRERERERERERKCVCVWTNLYNYIFDLA